MELIACLNYKFPPAAMHHFRHNLDFQYMHLQEQDGFIMTQLSGMQLSATAIEETQFEPRLLPYVEPGVFDEASE